MKDCTVRFGSGTASVGSGIAVSLENLGDCAEYVVKVNLPEFGYSSDAAVKADRLGVFDLAVNIPDAPIPAAALYDAVVYAVSGDYVSPKRKTKITIIPKGWFDSADDALSDRIMKSVPSADCGDKRRSVFEDASEIYEKISWMTLEESEGGRYFRIRPRKEIYDNDGGTEIDLAMLYAAEMGARGHHCKLFLSPEGAFVGASAESDAFPFGYLVVRPSDGCRKVRFGKCCDDSRIRVNALMKVFKGPKYISV